MSMRTLIVGSRGSKLALEQTRRVRERLAGATELRVVHTSGDHKPTYDGSAIGMFTKEIEDELIGRQIDLAVHSLKDLPTLLAAGLHLVAVLRRDEVSDLLLVRPEAIDLDRAWPVKPGSRIGTSSLRRQTLLRAQQPDLECAPIVGNVTTRIDKVRRGDCDALIMARAGLSRLALGVAPLIAYDLNPELWICAPGQGAIAVEARIDDSEALERARPLHDAPTAAAVQAERELLLAYGGGCHAPFGAYARLVDGQAAITVAAPDRGGQFRRETFVATTMAAAQSAAAEWIHAGCPGRATKPEDTWICRPALPWC